MPPLQLFPADPTKSFPYFNTYRLISDSGENFFPTPSSPSSSSSSSPSTLTFPIPPTLRTTLHRLEDQVGYKELKSRVGWDLISEGKEENEVVWVDREYRVVRLGVEVSGDVSVFLKGNLSGWS